MLLNARVVLPGYSKHSDSGISQPHRMQTFDVSTNILDSQLSFFQRGRAGKSTQAAEQQEPSVAAVHIDPVVKPLPCLRLKLHDLLKLVVTQVVVLVVLLLLSVSLGRKVWYKIGASVGLCMIPVLVTKAEASSLLLLLLLLHDVCVLLLML